MFTQVQIKSELAKFYSGIFIQIILIRTAKLSKLKTVLDFLRCVSYRPVRYVILIAQLVCLDFHESRRLGEDCGPFQIPLQVSVRQSCLWREGKDTGRFTSPPPPPQISVTFDVRPTNRLFLRYAPPAPLYFTSEIRQKLAFIHPSILQTDSSSRSRNNFGFTGSGSATLQFLPFVSGPGSFSTSRPAW